MEFRASRHFVMRQMRVEVERRNVPQKAEAVEIVVRREWSNFVCAFHERGPKAVGVVHRNAKPLHQRARVLPEPLLTRHERVAVMQIFHLSLLHVAGEADIMMGCKEEAGAVPLQPFADRRDLLRRRLLFGENMVEPEHHQGVGVSENAFVDRQLVAGLVDPLEDGDRMVRCFAGDLLEAEG